MWLIILSALLRQAFAHCGKFPTAASRGSLGRVSVPVWLVVLSDQLLISLDRVSVPVWLIILSDQLPVFALVSHYLANKLMGRGLIP